MGAGYYKPVTHWSRGEYNSANNQEDDLAIMSGATYNVGYRNDDHSNTIAGATNLARNGSSAERPAASSNAPPTRTISPSPRPAARQRST